MYSYMIKFKERLYRSREFSDMSNDFCSSKCTDEVSGKQCFEK